MVRISEMTDSLDVGLDCDTMEFDTNSLMNPTMSSETESNENPDQGVSENPEPADSGISSPPKVPPLKNPLAPEAPAVAASSASDPAAASTSAPLAPTNAVATASQTHQTLHPPRDWMDLWSNLDGREFELSIYSDNAAVGKKLLNELIAKSKQQGKVLVINDVVQRTQGGVDRVKYLQQVLLSELAEHSDRLHLAEFRDGPAMKSIVALAQTLFASGSKYAEVAHFIVKSNLDTAKNRQNKYRAGPPPTPVITVSDSPPAPRIVSMRNNLLASPTVAPASAAVAVGAGVAPTTLATVTGAAWPAPSSAPAGWGAPSTSTTPWPVPVTTSGLVAPPRPATPIQAQGVPLQRQNELLRAQVDALISTINAYTEDASAPQNGNRSDRGSARGRGRGRGQRRNQRGPYVRGSFRGRY